MKDRKKPTLKKKMLMFGSFVAVSLFTGLFMVMHLVTEKSASAASRQNGYLPSSLPRVELITDDGRKLQTKEEWRTATLKVSYYDETSGAYVISDTYECEYKGRGNSTWYYYKKPFNIKFSQKEDFLGMDKAKRFSFIANWLDRTNMRNYVTYTIADFFTRQNYGNKKVKADNYLGEGWRWTPQGKFAEVFVDGQYMGLFYVAETIRIADNRLELVEEKDGQEIPIENQGLLFEMSIDGWSWKTDIYKDEIHNSKGYIPYNVKFPDYTEDLDDREKGYARSYINDIEATLFTEPSDENWKAICEKIDVTSFADFWIVQALASNGELTHPKSIFMYKNNSDPDFEDKNADALNGRLFAGPVWDFDWGTYDYNTVTAEYPEDTFYYAALFEYEEFCNIVKERWELIRPWLSTDLIESIDETAHLINVAQNNDDIQFGWKKRYHNNINFDSLFSFDKSIMYLKAYIISRRDALDDQIAALFVKDEEERETELN